MAFDTDKLRSHLKESGLFSDAEIEAEVLSAQKDAKAEERRTILNTQKVETPAVAQSSPAIAAAPAVAASAAAPSVAPVQSAPPITGATTPAELFDMRPKGTPVERIGGMIGEAGTAAVPVAANATQSSLDYARDAIANNPELTGALAAIPVLYGANKLGLFDTLGSKMSSTAQPQPFVGGSGPRNTPSAPTPAPTPAVTPIQDWDIHGEPALFAPTPAATTETPPAKPSQNLNLTEATDRMKNVTPAAGEFVGPMQPVGPPEFTGPRRPVVPTPPAALAATTTPAPVEPPPNAKLTWPGLAEEPGPLRWTANTLGTTKDVKGSQAAFEMAKDKLTALGVDLAPVHPETGKKTGGGLIPEGHAALNDFYQTYTGESLPKGGKIESEQKLKLYDALKTHLEEAHASGTLKNLGRGAIAAASILGISEAVKAAQRGDNSKLAELGFDVGISAIPPMRLAATALMGTNAGAPTVRSEPFAEVLNRPGVRQVLQNMSQTMPSAQFNAARDQYLSKVSSFPEYNSSRFTKPVIGSTQPINRRTLLPIAPPR